MGGGAATDRAAMREAGAGGAAVASSSKPRWGLFGRRQRAPHDNATESTASRPLPTVQTGSTDALALRKDDPKGDSSQVGGGKHKQVATSGRRRFGVAPTDVTSADGGSLAPHPQSSSVAQLAGHGSAVQLQTMSTKPSMDATMGETLPEGDGDALPDDAPGPSGAAHLTA